ncbi:MAG: P-II family nitrogen regulator [Streptococcaceae bacterium]|jgi:nitrogen regulatory protein P-II 1|nr:P-II family nitrogen regulator [Streptococcaceae bacterium]
MKKIEAIIRTDKLEDLKQAFREVDIVHGMTVSQVLGHGEQKGFTEYIRGQAIETTLLAKIKVEIVCKDNDVDGIVDLIIKSVRTGDVGDGKIFVQPIDHVIRIRTGEKDGLAL